MSTGDETIAPMPGLEASWRSLEIAGGIIAALGLLGIVFPYVTGISMIVVGRGVHRMVSAMESRSGAGG